jgi:hypothetical protein
VDSHNPGLKAFRRISYVKSGVAGDITVVRKTKLLEILSPLPESITILKSLCALNVLSVVLSRALTPVMKNAHIAGTSEYLFFLVLM